MQVLTDKIYDKYVTNNKCKLCGETLNKKEMKDIITFRHGNINHDIEDQKVFKEVTQTIYLHKNCMKLKLHDQFNDTWKLLFKDRN